PCANRVEKIMSSNVSPSPSAYQGPSQAMRSSTSAAGVFGSAAKRQEQRRQYNSTCMADLPSGSFASAGPRLRGGEGADDFRQTCDGSGVTQVECRPPSCQGVFSLDSLKVPLHQGVAALGRKAWRPPPT